MTLAVVRDQSEIALVLRARAGDHDAFGELVDLRLNATFRSVMAILGNESDARDVTQAIFLQAWTNLPSLRDPAFFSAWFGRIVVNSARTALQRSAAPERPRDPGEWTTGRRRLDVCRATDA